MKVLLAEDQPTMAECLVRALKETPGTIVTVTDSLAGVMRLLAFQEWDLILLDLTLADASREQTAAKIPEMITKCPSLIIVTGTEEDIVRNLPGMIPSIPVAEKSRLFERPGFLQAIIARLIPMPDHAIKPESARETAESIAKMRQILPHE